MTPIRVVTLAGDAEREAEVAAAIARERDIDLVMRCVERVEALASVRGGELDAVLAVGPVRWFDYQCVEEARAAGIRLLGHAADPIEAELLEVAGFSVLPPDAPLSDMASVEPPDARPSLHMPAPAGKVVAVWGPKGAPGRTTVAIELATILANTEPMTLLADADLYGGDVVQLLGVVEELPGVVAIARASSRGELRAGGWADELKRSRGDGPLLLPGLLRAELWTEISAFGWRELVSEARRKFRYSIFDVGFCLEEALDPSPATGRNEIPRSTVADADVVVAVLRADPVGVRSFLWAIEGERDLLARDKLVVVANRVRPGEERQIKTIIRRHLGHYPAVLIPDRPDHVTDAVWNAEPVALVHPESPVTEGIRTLAAAIGGRVQPNGFLSRLIGRRSHV